MSVDYEDEENVQQKITENSSLEEIIHDAINQVDTFRHPDLEIFRKRINLICESAGLSSTCGDTITRISWYKEYLEIDTEYYTRNCHQTDNIKIPNSILKANDPIETAKEYRKNEELKKAYSEIQGCEYALEKSKDRLNKIKEKYGVI